jgi:hypothetical protein
MADRSAELFAAIYAVLAADAPLVALIGADKVFNGVKDGTALPYVDIGDDTATDYGSSSGDAQEHTVTIHCWANQPLSGKSAKLLVTQMVAAVRLALHDVDLTLSAGVSPNLRCEFRETARDPDGVSWHGVLRFRAVTQN